MPLAVSPEKLTARVVVMFPQVYVGDGVHVADIREARGRHLCDRPQPQHEIHQKQKKSTSNLVDSPRGKSCKAYCPFCCNVPSGAGDGVHVADIWKA